MMMAEGLADPLPTSSGQQQQQLPLQQYHYAHDDQGGHHGSEATGGAACFVRQSLGLQFVTDPLSARLLHASKGAQKVLGYSEREFLQLSIFDLTDGFVSEFEWRDSVRQLLRSGQQMQLSFVGVPLCIKGATNAPIVPPLLATRAASLTMADQLTLRHFAAATDASLVDVPDQPTNYVHVRAAPSASGTSTISTATAGGWTANAGAVSASIKTNNGSGGRHQLGGGLSSHLRRPSSGSAHSLFRRLRPTRSSAQSSPDFLDAVSNYHSITAGSAVPTSGGSSAAGKGARSVSRFSSFSGGNSASAAPATDATTGTSSNSSSGSRRNIPNSTLRITLPGLTAAPSAAAGPTNYSSAADSFPTALPPAAADANLSDYSPRTASTGCHPITFSRASTAANSAQQRPLLNATAPSVALVITDHTSASGHSSGNEGHSPVTPGGSSIASGSSISRASSSLERNAGIFGREGGTASFGRTCSDISAQLLDCDTSDTSSDFGSSSSHHLSRASSASEREVLMAIARADNHSNVGMAGVGRPGPSTLIPAAGTSKFPGGIPGALSGSVASPGGSDSQSLTGSPAAATGLRQLPTTSSHANSPTTAAAASPQIWVGLDLQLFDFGRGRELVVTAHPYVSAPAGSKDMIANAELAKEKRKQKESERRRFQETINKSRDLVFVRDEAEEYVAVNKAMANYFGMTVEQFLASPINKLHSAPNGASELASLSRQDKEVLKSLSPLVVGEQSLSTPNGQSRLFRIVKAPLLPGLSSGSDRSLVISYASDLTNSIRQKEALSRLGVEHQTVFDLVGLGTATIGRRSDKISTVNSALCSMLGLSADAFAGKHLHEFVFPEDKQAYQVAFREFRRARGVYHRELRFKRKDGSACKCRLTWVQSEVEGGAGGSWGGSGGTGGAALGSGGAAEGMGSGGSLSMKAGGGAVTSANLSFALCMFEEVQPASKAMELALVEERLRLMVKHLSVGAIFLPIEEDSGMIINRPLEKMIGFDATEIKSRQKLYDIFSPADSAEAVLSSNPQQSRRRVLARCRNGARKWLEVTVYLEEVGEVWLVHDISEEQMANEKFQALFDNSVNPIFICDGQQMLHCNRAALKLLRVEKEEQLRQFAWPFDISPGTQPDGRSSREVREEAVALIRQRGELTFEWRHENQDGSNSMLVQATSKALRINDQDLFLVSWHDLTAQKQQEEELRLAKDAAEKVSVAKSRFLANMSHEIRTPMNGVIGIAELLKQTQLSEEQQSYVDIIRSSGQSLMTILSDILDLSKIEAQTVEMEACSFDVRQLVQGVQQLMEVGAQSKGLKINSVIDDSVPPLVIGDSQKLQQVLTNLVSNSIKFTQEGCITISLHAAPEHESPSRSSPSSSSSSSPQSTSSSPHAASPSPHAAASSSPYASSSSSPSTISLRSPSPHKPRPSHSPSASNKALPKSSADKTPKPSKKAPKPFDHHATKEAAPPAAATSAVALHFEVADTGVGIEPSALQRVFRAFAQADSSTSRKYGGTGLGLAICKSLVGLMGGEICVTSELGKGSKFFFTIVLGVEKSSPRGGGKTEVDAQEGGRDVEARGARGKERGGRERAGRKGFKGRQEEVLGGASGSLGGRTNLQNLKVLLAEDNKTNQLVASKMLFHLGMKCDIVETGGQAVEAHQKNSYDVIFMDCQMPEMDGYEATRQIRNDESLNAHRGHVKIVALTASALAHEKEDCAKAGMDYFLTKPMLLTDLSGVLSEDPTFALKN